MMGQTRDILHWAQPAGPYQGASSLGRADQHQGLPLDAVSAINDKMDDINSTMRTASNQLTDKMRAVTAQVSVVSNLMLDAVEEISDPGQQDHLRG